MKLSVRDRKVYLGVAGLSMDDRARHETHLLLDSCRLTIQQSRQRIVSGQATIDRATAVLLRADAALQWRPRRPGPVSLQLHAALALDFSS